MSAMVKYPPKDNKDEDYLNFRILPAFFLRK